MKNILFIFTTLYIYSVTHIIAIPGQIGINFPVENLSTYNVTIEVFRHGNDKVLWGQEIKDIESVNSNNTVKIPIVSERNTMVDNHIIKD